MVANTQQEGPVRQLATDGPSGPTTLPAKRLPRDDPSLAVIGILVLFAVLGYIISRNLLPFWVWLPLPLIGIARNAALFVQRRRASASRAADDPTSRSVWMKAKETDSPEPAILPSKVIQEARAYGLEMAVGTSGAGAFQISVIALPLSNDSVGLVVLHSVAPPPQGELRHVLKRTWRQSTTAQQTGARFLRAIDEHYDPACAFVGIWKAQVRELTYFAAGFEAPSVFNVGWPHRSELAIERKTEHGLQKVTFGVHHLSERERWLLYTKPLVDVSDPGKEPFNLVGIIQYAHDDRCMANELWVDYLLGLGLRAHGGELPTGSVPISLACSQVEVPYDVKSRRIDGPLPTSRLAPSMVGQPASGADSHGSWQ